MRTWPAMGEPAPHFMGRTHSNPRYAIDTAAGRFLLLYFFGSASHPLGRAALEIVSRARALFDDDRIAFFGVSFDSTDEALPEMRGTLPGVRFLFDPERVIGRLYGVPIDDDGGPEAPDPGRLGAVLIDPTMRVIGRYPLPQTEAQLQELIGALARLPIPDLYTGREIHAPVLVAPLVFEPEFCRRLIEYYESRGGQESGFMRQIDGKTVPVYDYSHKRRADVVIDDDAICDGARQRIYLRLVPMIEKAFQFKATRMERYIVACYEAETGGHFNAHRDNTTVATKHRKFAVTINLNDDYEGGEICFPEFNKRSYKPPPGGAVVFSCSLLHRVYPMQRGRRFAFLPFLYDDAAAELREATRRSIATEALDLRAPAPDGERDPSASAADRP